MTGLEVFLTGFTLGALKRDQIDKTLFLNLVPRLDSDGNHTNVIEVRDLATDVVKATITIAKTHAD